MTRVLIVAALLAGCATEPPDPGAPPEQLPLPDVSGVDFEAAFSDALDVLLATDMRSVWAGHRASLSPARPGCPDLWLGDVEDATEPGTSWQDHCTTPGGTGYDGVITWASEASLDGDPESMLGAIASGRRTLLGDATVEDRDASALLFDWGGEAEDAFTSNVAPDYLQWSYSSTVRGEGLGAAGFGPDAPLPGGWRADLYVAYSGGAVAGVEARGELLLHEQRVGDRFAGVAGDFVLPGPESAAPGVCVDEPTGWISVRDDDAYWYDLVFQPRWSEDGTGEPYENYPYGECEGCGTLYIRGVEQGTICLDVSRLFDGALMPPAIEDYVLSVRGPEAR